MKQFYTFALLAFFGLSINVNAQPPNFLWAKQFGGSNFEEGSSIAVDDNGNTYTTGWFLGEVDFNPANEEYQLLTSAGNYDVFVTKLDASGNLLWAKRWGGTANDEGTFIAIDANGNIYITGNFEQMVDFDPGPGIVNLNASNGGVFVTKLDPSGNFLWAKNFGGLAGVAGGLAVNPIGNVSITGYFSNTADFDPGSGTFNLTSSTAFYSDIFVSTLDASGNFLWAKQFGGIRDDKGNSIAVDASGNVYVTGDFRFDVDFDPGSGTFNLSSAGGRDVFVFKLDAVGNFLWAKRWGSPNGGDTSYGDEGVSIVIDTDGNVYTTGYFEGTADFDPGPPTHFLASEGATDVFVSKLDALGNFHWAKTWGGDYQDEGRDIAVDAIGNPYTTGYFRDVVDFNPGSGTFSLTAGNSDAFVSKLDVSGNFLWAGQFGGIWNNEVCHSVAVDVNENVYTTGFFGGIADFDPGNAVYNMTPLINNFNNDVFVVKLCQLAAPSITGMLTFCQGDSTTLTSSEANSYLWSNDSTSRSITVSTPGNYSVTVSSASGCSAASTAITVIAVPVPTVTVNSPTICAGESATLTANGAATYLWSTGATGDSITVSPTATTTYTVTGTTAGCASAPVSAQVTVINLSVNLGADTILLQAGQSDTLSAGVDPGATYSWSTGESTPSIIVMDAGTYIVTATKEVCTVTDSVVVVVISTSAADLNSKYKITVSPNPTQDAINIKCEGSPTISVQVFDNLGRLIIEDNSFAPDGATRSLLLGKLPGGMYYVKIAGDEFVRIVPVVKN